MNTSIQFSREELELLITALDSAVKAYGLRVSQQITPVVNKVGLALQQLNEELAKKNEQDKQQAEAQVEKKEETPKA